eukprot:TRINITY_DN1319_c1_g1_i1.p1 TRINITY_DN1319_c1_g1~~TRINITY_DN1319_c1_g1_i1.p1  ORF type:complete len:1490 (+),score=207.23 TRINITY_DN1319_c1_g1_i1:33-4502(+)
MLKCIILLFALLFHASSERTINHPFLWFEDTFSTLDPSIWALDEYGFYTTSAGLLTADTPFPLYLTPNTSTSAWTLPTGAEIQSIAVSLSGGTFYNQRVCCIQDWAFGVQNILYKRIGFGSFSGRAKIGYQCQQSSTNSTCISSGDGCNPVFGTWEEKFYISGGSDLFRTTQSVCGVDYCQCRLWGANYPSGTLPTQNFTTILTAVSGGKTNITVPGFGLSSAQVPSSSYPFDGAKMTFFAIGGAPAYQFTSTLGFYASANPWPTVNQYDTFQVLFSGQCYDNNTAAGDGCNASYVEPMCRCFRTSAIWGSSVCSCARTAGQVLAMPKQGTVKALDLTGAVVISSNLNYSGSAVWYFDSCPHPALTCQDTRVSRYLAVIVNDSLTLVAPINISANLSIDLSPFGAPFPVGSRVKLVFWSNVAPGLPAGLFNLDGPFVSESTEYTILPFSPAAQSSTGNFTAEHFDIVGGFRSQVWLTSSLRLPSRVDFWVYNGPIGFAASKDVAFSEDSTLTMANIFSCVSQATGNIFHNCSVFFPNPPYPENPSYVVARVWDGSNAGIIRSIGIRVLPQPVLPPLADFVAQNTLSIAVSGLYIDRRSSWQVYCGGSAIESFEISRNTTTGITMGLASLLIPNADVTFRWTLLGYVADIALGYVFPSPPLLNRTANTRYFWDNVTITVSGAGFLPGQPQKNRLILTQPGVPSAPQGTILFVNATHMTFTLNKRLPSGGLFASVAVLEGLPSEPIPIGFYNAYSAFNREPFPSDIDLSVASRWTFALTGVISSIQDGPTDASLRQIRISLANLLQISEAGLYMRYSFYPSQNLTVYSLDAWFVSPEAVLSFNENPIVSASNTSILASVLRIISEANQGRFNASLTSSTLAIDSTWPYVVFGLSSVSGIASSISESSIQDLIFYVRVLWKVSAADLHAAVQRPDASNSSDDLELTFYFRTLASQRIFLSTRLPENATMMARAPALLSASLNDAYEVRFVRATPLPALERTVNVDWLYVKYLMVPASSNTTASARDFADALADSVASLTASSITDLYLQFLPTSKKRDASSSYLTIFFTTVEARAALLAFGLPDNTTFFAAVSNTLAAATSYSFNSTFVETNVPSKIQSAPKAAADFPLWQIIVGVIAAVLFIAIVVVVIVVVYRRRFRAVENLEATAVRIPKEMQSMFSIKGSDLIYGEKIGEGSFGAVYRAQYKNETVAVKKLSAAVLAAQVSDFFREANLMLGIPPHPNVVHVRGMCQEFGQFAMVMDLAESSLDKYTKARSVSPSNQLSEQELFMFARGIARGMAHLAHHRIVHRDLAARNILLDHKNVPKISDFGFSRVVGEDNAKGKTSSTIGPVRWMSPESIGKLEYGEKSDVWSFGAILIELVTGDVPFPGLDIVEVATKVRDGLSTALDYVPKDCAAPGWVLKLMQKCFTFDEASRPDFMAIIAFLDDMEPEGYETRRPSAPPPRPVPTRPPPSVQTATEPSGDTKYEPIRFN